jgi:predicted protein tyrosine phosphatase
MNKRRSATAERIYRDDARLEVRSAGTKPDANRRIKEQDLRWADIVFAMERDQKQRISEEFRDMELPWIEVLEIPDDYEFMDPRLQKMLRHAIDPEIESLLAGEGSPDDGDQKHGVQEMLHQVGSFEPLDAKRVLSLLEANSIPFEIEMDNSALERPGRWMELSLGMFPEGSRLIVFVPESKVAAANALVLSLFPV